MEQMVSAPYYSHYFGHGLGDGEWEYCQECLTPYEMRYLVKLAFPPRKYLCRWHHARLMGR